MVKLSEDRCGNDSINRLTNSCAPMCSLAAISPKAIYCITCYVIFPGSSLKCIGDVHGFRGKGWLFSAESAIFAALVINMTLTVKSAREDI